MQRIETPATIQHGKAMEPHMRSSSCPGLAPASAYRQALEASTFSWALVDGETPLMVWGIITPDLLGPRAILWSMISEKISEYPLLSARVSKKFCSWLRTQYEKVETVTDKNYELSNKWVRWLGFIEVPSSELGVRNYILGR